MKKLKRKKLKRKKAIKVKIKIVSLNKQIQKNKDNMNFDDIVFILSKIDTLIKKINKL